MFDGDFFLLSTYIFYPLHKNKNNKNHCKTNE